MTIEEPTKEYEIMKTPEEIKKGLKCCHVGECECDTCTYKTKNACMHWLKQDALAYIQQLESRLAQVERERDAAVNDMHQLQGATCAYCKNLYRPDGAEHVHCRVFGDLSRFGEDENYNPLICGRFEWRGVCAENTKEDSDGKD